MDFSDAEASDPTQSFDIVETREGAEYQAKSASLLLVSDKKLIISCRAAKFTGITSLTIHFPGNISDGEEDTTRIFYIGLRGKWSPVS